MSLNAPSGALTYPPAELDRRFYAFAIDRLIAWSLYAVGVYVAYRYLLEPGKVTAGVAVIVGTVLVVGLVSAVLLGLSGVSPGKAVVGLRVVRDTDGAPIGVARSILRGLVLGIATLPTFGIGVATLAWTAVMDRSLQRRGWHDHLTRAVVVDVRRVPVVDEVVDERPRQIVNLTAMRLVPALASPAAEPMVPAPVRAPRPSSPPPASPPASPPPASPPAYRPPSPASAPSPPPIERVAPASPPPPPISAPSPVVSPATGSATGSASSRDVIAPLAPKLGPPLVAQPGPEVPRWRVAFDTGETFVVLGLALVGRRPEARAGESVSHLIALRSSDMSLSKTHAQFQVTPAGALVVMDRGSTNGSIVIRQGVSKALTAGRPATLLADDRVRFGDRQMTVERA